MKLFDENNLKELMRVSTILDFYIFAIFSNASIFSLSFLVEFLLLDRANCPSRNTLVRPNFQAYFSFRALQARPLAINNPPPATRFSLSTLLIVRIPIFLDRANTFIAHATRAACNTAIFPAGRRSRGDERGGKRRTKRR